MKKKEEKIYPKRKNNKFFFDISHKPESLLFGTIPSFIQSLFSRQKTESHEKVRWISCNIPASCSISPTITWIGHASFLIQVGGVNILTDPIFGNLSPFFPRILPAGIQINNLPKIDVVLISHNHRDHMDATSLQLLKHNYKIHFLVPYGDKHWFDRRKFTSTIEHEWWQDTTLSLDDNQKFSCTFLPAMHWSQRGLFDKNTSLWGSWLIECNGYRIYFGGDTAYSPHFESISHHYSNINIALLPIGPCEPREWMKKSHLDAAHAGKAFLDLQAQHFIPMHWGTFAFGTDNFRIPIDRLRSWWYDNHANLKEKRLHVLKVGKPINFNT